MNYPEPNRISKNIEGLEEEVCTNNDCDQNGGDRYALVGRIPPRLEPVELGVVCVAHSSEHRVTARSPRVVKCSESMFVFMDVKRLEMWLAASGFNLSARTKGAARMGGGGVCVVSATWRRGAESR